MSRHLLIAGCGDVGSALAAHLLAQPAPSWTVYGLRRTAAALPAGVRPVVASLTEPGLAARLPPVRLDAVVLCAAADASTPEAYAQAYPAAAAALVAALAARHEAEARLLFTSSTAMYEADDGRWVDETSPTAPRHFRGQAMLAAEAAVLRHGGTAVRLGGVYGPGRGTLIDGLRAGTARVPARPSYSNRIHRDDVVGVLAHLLDHPAPPPCLLAVDDRPACRGTVLRFLARRLGLPPPAVAAAAHRARAAPPEAGVAAAHGGKRCSNARLRASGYQLRYPTFVEGYGTLLA